MLCRAIRKTFRRSAAVNRPFPLAMFSAIENAARFRGSARKETEPPHSRGEVLDRRLSHCLKVAGVRDLKRVIDRASGHN